MKRSFREPKNLFKNKAKNARQKMNSINHTKPLENKGNFNAQKAQKKPKIAQNTAQIRLLEKAKDD